MRAHEDAFLTLHEALGVVGGLAADDADGERLGDVLGDGEQLGHRLERLAEIVLIEPRDDDAPALIRERVADRRQLDVEELTFVDADDLRVGQRRARAGRASSATVSDAIRISLCDVTWPSP